jgi:hypothetical protein
VGVRADVRAALDARLLTATGIPDADHRASENAGYQPIPGDPWVRAQLGFGPEELFTVPAAGGWRVHTGLYFVDLFYPLDAGPGAADTLAEAVLARFAPGQSLTGGSTTFRVTRSQRRGGFRETDWYQVPLEVAWQVEAINTVT